MEQKNWLWVGALGIAAIIVIVVVIFAVRGSQTQQIPSTETITTTTAPQILANSISATNQPAGQTAKIDGVSLKESGYVVIHEDSDGKPGKVIGNSSVLQPGAYTNLTVNLTRASKNGETLHPMLHSDDGDGTYGFPDEDFPIKDEEGNIVITKFTVGGSPSPTAASQGQVTVTYSGTVFSPSQVEVASGGKVTIVNNSTKQLQIASDPHPVHTDNKEVSGGKFTLDIQAGQSASVTLVKSGIWGYHDHLNPSVKGKLTVK